MVLGDPLAIASLDTTGNATIGGSMSVAGAVTLSSTLAVSGQATVDGVVSTTSASLLRGTDSSLAHLSGSDSVTTGANYRMFGSAHPSDAGVHSWRSGTDERMRLTSSGTLLVNTSVTTGVSAGDVVVPNSRHLRSVDAAGTGTIGLVRSSGDRLSLNANSDSIQIEAASTSTSASAGGNGDVPAQVAGYLTVRISGTDRKIPYYA